MISKEKEHKYDNNWKIKNSTNLDTLAVGSLVVKASDSRPEGLGSMLDVTKYPPSHQIPSECSLNQWVRSLVGLFASTGTGEYFPPLQFTCRNCGGGDRGRVVIYRPFGEFHRA
ncbi:hypothetical protein TNCV_1457291 [Trichonephila clavipes]|nr:hypothetical protein TNCV_1457291 [Trichonephila clavipes]